MTSILQLFPGLMNDIMKIYYRVLIQLYLHAAAVEHGKKQW